MVITTERQLADINRMSRQFAQKQARQLREKVEQKKLEKEAKKAEREWGKTKAGKLETQKFDLEVSRAKRLAKKKYEAQFKQPSYAKKGAGSGAVKGVLALAQSFGIPTGVGPQGGVSKSQGKVKRGRGRPEGTYEPRVLPNGQVVKMPIQQFKKVASAMRKQMEVQQALQQAQLRQQQTAQSAQIQMQQDPRFSQTADDSWLAQDDPVHEQRLAMAEQQAQMRAQAQAGQPGALRRLAGSLGRGMERIGARAGAGQPMGPGGNILDAPSTMMGGRPQERGMGPTPGRITLMQGQPRAQRLNIWGGATSPNPADSILGNRESVIR